MEINFKVLLKDIDAALNAGTDRDVTLFNICKLLKDEVYHYDWVGFYIADSKSKNLILGPFSGKPTDHTLIPFGKGVCGQVAVSKQIKTVQDVTAENNYLSCSLDVQSEIVLPVLKNDSFVAELDIDSHSSAPFTKEDEEFLSSVCRKVSDLF